MGKGIGAQRQQLGQQVAGEAAIGVQLGGQLRQQAGHGTTLPARGGGREFVRAEMALLTGAEYVQD
ncbi:hypothetical protein TSOC_000906 [Tetrabaena socialis]|uniref:Uncharacterized protein n=1 Tax=Tetrabaena socialis TaxID=47790 RepID=A0A2J8AI59_9CHLO|nr:hypothetical protein TSOC_000906 [Tetrabaena socialis]|eukprot:PNH12202.1 hypothetical protein TSOC_000906 [Tetrabaena socialis]